MKQLWDRWAPLTGPLSVACSLVGVMLVLNQPQDKDSDAKIAAYFAGHSHRVHGVVAFFSTWELYGTAVAGVGALFMLQNALQAGSLIAVQPPLTLGDALISACYGVTVFGEDVQTGGWLLAAEIVAVLAIAVGCIELSRSLALVHVPKQAELAGEPGADRVPGDRRPAGRLAAARGHRPA